MQNNKPLTAEDLVIGGKYVPIKKTVDEFSWELEKSHHWNEAKKLGQPFLYYRGKEEDGSHYFSHNNDENDNGGDYFLPSDVIPYIEEERAVNVPENARISAMEWWNNLNALAKDVFGIEIYNRNPNFLTGREIEAIHNLKTKQNG